MTKYSIIIPVYNAEQTIARCLDSIVSRKADDYEIILINDGSADRSDEICRQYSERHSVIKYFVYDNSGSGAARNRGLEKASGEFILFCDADDSYVSDEFNSLLDSLQELINDADLLCFDYMRRWADYEEKIPHFEDAVFEFDSPEDSFACVSTGMIQKKIGVGPINKVFRRIIITDNHIVFPEKKDTGNKTDWGEDLMFNIQYVLCCKKICSISNVVYCNYKIGSREKPEERYFTDDIVLHMTRMLQFTERSWVWTSCYSDKPFYLLFSWHIRNYIYDIIRRKGVCFCRNIIAASEEKSFILGQFRNTLHNWNQFLSDRKEIQTQQDYKYILQYICDGNMFLFKLNNKIASWNGRKG